MKKITKIITLLALAILCLSLTACGSTKVDMEPYISVSFTGCDGNGTARFDFDYADFEYEIMSQWDEDDRTFAKLAELTALETTINCQPATAEGLRNGDKITVTMTCDEDKAKELGYSFSGMKKTFTVEGLTEPIMIDPFDESYLTLSVQGTSPFAYLDILYTGSRSEPQAYITYQADKQYDLKNGDTVTITATMSERYTQQGYLLTRNEMTLTVEGLPGYITDVSALSAADVSAIRGKLEAYFDAQIDRSYLDLTLADGDTSFMNINDIGSVGELTFADIGYAVVQDGWGVTAAVLVPFHVDVNDVTFYWWNGEYYAEPLSKTFPDMSGYFIVTDLLLDGSGQLIQEGSFYIEMSAFYESEQQMADAITARYGFEGVSEGVFAN